MFWISFNITILNSYDTWWFWNNPIQRIGWCQWCPGTSSSRDKSWNSTRILVRKACFSQTMNLHGSTKVHGPLNELIAFNYSMSIQIESATRWLPDSNPGSKVQEMLVRRTNLCPVPDVCCRPLDQNHSAPMTMRSSLYNMLWHIYEHVQYAYVYIYIDSTIITIIVPIIIISIIVITIIFIIWHIVYMSADTCRRISNPGTHLQQCCFWPPLGTCWNHWQRDLQELDECL